MARLLFFDILKILSVMMIVVVHVAAHIGIPWITATIDLPVDSGHMGMIGVAILIFVSGAVLEYNYGGKRIEYIPFIQKRILRIYPAYIFSILLLVCIIPPLMKWDDILLASTGFVVPLTGGWGHSTVVLGSWFIGTILCLYLMYPILSKVINKYGLIGFFAIAVFALAIRSLTGNGSMEIMDWYWNPLSRMLEFSLGVFMVHYRLYLKTESFDAIKFLADISFPVFLVHYALLALNVNISEYVFVVAMVSIVVYCFDSLIHTIIPSLFILIHTTTNA